MVAISGLTKFTQSIFLFFLVAGCANQLPPTGGDVDRIPPEIVEVFPPDGTTSFDEDYFEIEFSEYVDKRSVREAIFISPFIEGILDFEWTGTSVEITFPEELKEDITYTVTVGTDVVDRNNKNRMIQSYSFSFSTGDKIDRKIISGRIYGKEREGIFLYAYKLSANNDTLLNIKPDYVSQSGVNGNYSLNGLASGTYRVFAVNDKFKDLIYQQEQDKIGIPYKDVLLTEADSVFTNLNFILFNADTTRPRIINAVMTDKYHLLVTLNKEIMIEVLSAKNFSLYDSAAGKKFEVNYLFKGQTKPEEIILVVEPTQNEESQIFLLADSLVDQFGNVTLNDSKHIITSDRPDTSAVKIISTEPLQHATVDFRKPEIKIFFDDAFNKDEVNSAVSFEDTMRNPVQFKIDYYDDATLLISPLVELKPEKDYLIKLNLNKFKDAGGNQIDSLFSLKFKTISGLDFTGISGKLVSADNSDIDFATNPVLILESSEEIKIIYKEKITSEKFEFSGVEPGKYLLWCFLDEDGNGEFKYGYPFPFEYSENFYFYPDTLNLRPRWEITDLQFRLK